MATYASLPYQPNNPRQDENFGIWTQVALMREQKYQTKRQEIQQTIDAFGGMQFLRDSDNEYLANSLSSVVNKINEFGSVDLSEGSVGDELTANVRMAANDPVILNALENTTKYNNFQKQVQTLREKDPKLYSTLNHNFAMKQAGVEEYLAGATDKIGNLQYSNYVDVTDNALKKIKELKDLRGKQVIETADPQNPGRVIKRSIEGLTDQEIFEYIPNLLTPEESQQLTINGWGKYGGDLQTAQKNFNSYKTALTADVQEGIAEQNAIINNTSIPDSERSKAQVRLQSLTKQKENIDESLAAIDVNDPIQIGSFLEKNSWMKGIATAAKASWNTEYEKDEYYFAKERLELDYVQENRLQQKHLLEVAKLNMELGIGTDAVTVSAKEGDLPDEINPYEDLKKEYSAVTTEMTGIITAAVNSEKTPQEIRDHYAAELSKKGYDINGNVIKGKEAIAAQNAKSLAMKQAFDAANVGSVQGETARALAGIEIKRNNLSQEFETAQVDGITQAFNNNPDKYIAGFRNKYKESESDLQSDSISDEAARGLESLEREAREFVSNNGGWQNLKQTLQNNPAKLREFSEIADKLYNKEEPLTSQVARSLTFSTIRNAVSDGTFGGNLKNDALKISNDIIKERVKSNRNVVVTTANIATIGSKPTRERIINMLPQTQATALFNANNPISFEKTPEGDFRIIQNQGYTNTTKGGYANKAAEVIVSREDAAFIELQKYVDLDESQRGLDAARTKVKVKPTINIDYIDGNKKNLVGKADANINMLSPNVRNVFIADPSAYLTKQRIQAVFNSALKNKVPQEKIDLLVTSMGNNVNKLKPELKPFGDTWSMSVSTKAGKVLLEGDTGIKYLDNDWAYLIKSYPQVIASEGVLRYASENPTEIDNLINILEQ